MNNSRGFDSLDALIYASMKYVGDRELEEYNNVDPDIVFSERAQKRLIKRLMRERDYIENHKVYRPRLELFKRIAIAALIAITVLFTACMCIEPIRKAIFDFFVEEHEDYYAVEIVDTAPKASETQITENAPPTEILEYKEPKLPEDFERFELTKNKYRFYVEYENADTLIIYNQELIDKYIVCINNLGTNLIDVSINGCSGVMSEYTAGNVKNITYCWKDSEYSYMLTGNTDYFTLKSIAESIK